MSLYNSAVGAAWNGASGCDESSRSFKDLEAGNGMERETYAPSLSLLFERHNLEHFVLNAAKVKRIPVEKGESCEATT